jgi:hypothetical protein
MGQRKRQIARNFRQLPVKSDIIAKKAKDRPYPMNERVAAAATCQEEWQRTGSHSAAPEDAVEGTDRVVAARSRLGVRRGEIIVELGDRRVHVM